MNLTLILETRHNGKFIDPPGEFKLSRGSLKELKMWIERVSGQMHRNVFLCKTIRESQDRVHLILARETLVC